MRRMLVGAAAGGFTGYFAKTLGVDVLGTVFQTPSHTSKVRSDERARKRDALRRFGMTSVSVARVAT